MHTNLILIFINPIIALQLIDRDNIMILEWDVLPTPLSQFLHCGLRHRLKTTKQLKNRFHKGWILKIWFPQIEPETRCSLKKTVMKVRADKS